jgi:hypothetical protein
VTAARVDALCAEYAGGGRTWQTIDEDTVAAAVQSFAIAVAAGSYVELELTVQGMGIVATTIAYKVQPDAADTGCHSWIGYQSGGGNWLHYASAVARAGYSTAAGYQTVLRAARLPDGTWAYQYWHHKPNVSATGEFGYGNLPAGFASVTVAADTAAAFPIGCKWRLRGLAG